MTTKDLILERVNPEELIDILKLDIGQLMYHLDDCIVDAIEAGEFAFLQDSWTPSRIDIIGQNSNEGDHYDETT